MLAKIESQNEQGVVTDKTSEQFAKENPLFSIIQLNINQQGQPGEGPLIGFVNVKDTAKVAEYFRLAKEKKILSPFVHPKWGVKPVTKDGKYELVAIYSRDRDGKPAMTGSVITDAKVDFGQNSRSANVSMVMNPAGSKEWARLTKENI